MTTDVIVNGSPRIRFEKLTRYMLSLLRTTPPEERCSGDCWFPHSHAVAGNPSVVPALTRALVLIDADLSHADLCGAQMARAKLSQATLRGAELRGGSVCLNSRF